MNVEKEKEVVNPKVIMELETLVKQYKNMGYNSPNLINRDEEVQSIIKWLWDTYKVFINVNYMDMDFQTKPSTYMKFKGHYRYNCGAEHSTKFYCDKSFDNPQDAYYDALRHFLPGFRSQYKYAYDQSKKVK